MKELSIEDIQQMMEEGKITARELTENYLNRIGQIDKQGPKLNSILEINPEALDIAADLDKERQGGKIRGKLHGIPVLLKDNIGTSDKMTTTAGSLAFEGHIPIKDAFIVQQLRKAGAIILGKTNLSEWANFRSTHSSSGWSSRGGQTRNPYVLNRNPCGSSAGSAVAVAANLCTVAIGTETDGSIICPSQISGIVGIKPTLGLVSRTGIIPIAHSQDTAGPMARSVRDAAILLGAIAGKDDEDQRTLKTSSNIENDYTKYLDLEGLNHAKIGVARNYFGFNVEVDKIMENCISVMKKHGAEIIDNLKLPVTQELEKAEFSVLLYEFKHDLNQYLASIGKDIPSRTLNDLIDFNKQYKDRVMPFFGQEIFLLAQEKGSLADEEYQKAAKTALNLAGKEGIDKLLQDHNLDTIIAPSGSPAWLTDLINGDHFTGGSSTIAAVAGYPSITVPAGYIHELPIGISFIGGAFKEGILLKIAYSFEQASKVRFSPKFLPTLTLHG